MVLYEFRDPHIQNNCNESMVEFIQFKRSKVGVKRKGVNIRALFLGSLKRENRKFNGFFVGSFIQKTLLSKFANSLA